MDVKQQMDTKQLLDELDVNFKVERSTRFMISCGYFETPSGVDEFSRQSLLAGLALADISRERYNLFTPSKTTVLINDLGMDCGADLCEIVPPGVAGQGREVLEQLAFSAGTKNTLDFVRERNLRNRASRKIQAWLKTPTSDETLFRSENDILFRSELFPRVLAAAVNSAGVGVPRCPMINSEFLDVSFNKLRKDPRSTSQVLIDFNRIADREKVVKGTEMFLRRRSQRREIVVLVFFDPSSQDFAAFPYSSDDFL